MSESKLDLEFRRGYYIAVANIMRTHGADVIAKDVLRGYGNVDFEGIDPYDVKVLQPLADDIKPLDLESPQPSPAPVVDIDWREAPEWANYHTVDINGVGTFWEGKPTEQSMIWNDVEGCASLTRRPEGA